MLCSNFPAGARDRIGSERKQEDPADAGSRLFCVLGEGLAVAKLNSQAPDKNGGRGQFDQAVNPERDQSKANGGDAGANRHRSLDGHPGERKVLKPERLLDQRSPVMSNFGDASGARARNCTLNCTGWRTKF